METEIELPATKKQLWALFCITKKDFRNQNLTKKEASVMIKDFNQTKIIDLDDTTSNKIDIVQEFTNIIKETEKQLEKFKPTPMIVNQHKNMLDDNSKIVKSYFVEGGVCGFANLIIHYKTKENRKFVNAIKKSNYRIGKHYYGGFSLGNTIKTQSLETQEEYCRIMGKLLKTKLGVETSMYSRLD